MSEEKKIDLKDKMLSDDDLGQVSGGASREEIINRVTELRHKQYTVGLTDAERAELAQYERMGA